MKPVYVLIDKETGKFWKKRTYGLRRGVFAYVSEAKAQAVLNQLAKHQSVENVEIKRYECNETTEYHS